MQFINDPKHHWTQQQKTAVTLYFKGDKDFALELLETKLENISGTLQENQRFTSGVIETNDNIIAWTDHIRSWPIFYSQKGDKFFISNNARNVKNDANLSSVNDTSCLEFAMAGYVTGKDTLYNDLFCLQPGEYLIWNKNTKKLTITRYYRYTPILTDTTQDWDTNKHTLNELLDTITRNIIERAKGRPIWIPLSGGLDSRIILCKLHEHGYKNLHTFTYGPKFNFESKVAKKVAEKLTIPWVFISPTKSQIRRYFESDIRKYFWRTTDGLKAIASMREFSAIMNLREQSLVPDDAIFINGQSGDYITGGHISHHWTSNKNHEPSDLFTVLINKHYTLWKNINAPNDIEAVTSKIPELLPKDWEKANKPEEWASIEEQWEYDGRQVCLVANGQRIYDFFGYDWEMPLWEKSLVDFCETLPLEQKTGQALYKQYLKEYNYIGLFPETEPNIWRWPVPMLWVLPIAQIIGRVLGKNRKQNFYALMRYHGHYSNQFYSFPWNIHLITYKNARNVMSLNVRQWIIESTDIFSNTIEKKMGID